MSSLAAFAFAVAIQSPAPLDLYREGPYDAAVPRPERTLGYELGSRITTYRDQERVMDSIAASASARVRKFAYGKSHLGLPLRVFAISSAANIARLDAIRAAHQEIANGKTPTLRNLPAIVWINQCIHGNEPASFESAMALAYNLAAGKSARIGKMLDNTVVILNPVYNADGHERFATWYNAIARGSSDASAFERQEPSIIFGRTNFYRFDMNRDRVSFSQEETRAEFAEFLRWRPQIYIDQHGQVETYFFPPEPMSINANVDRARNAKWTDTIGRAIGRSFDAHGFQYFVGDTFDLYYPGYLDSSTTLSGAVGMTHETDGGKYLAQDRSDGSVNTLRRGLEKHFTSAMAVIEASAANRDALLASCEQFMRSVNTGKAAGKFQRVVVTSADPRPLLRLQRQLTYAGIVSQFAAERFSQPDAHAYLGGTTGNQDFPAGSLVVDMAQSQGALAKALLEPGQNFEPEFIEAQIAKKTSAPAGEEYPGPESPEFYDLTGWSLPFAHNLTAFWCESAPAIRAGRVSAPTPARPAESTVGYAIRYTDRDDILAVADILASGVRGSVSTRPMTLADGEYPAGTFVFTADRNNAGYADRIIVAASARGVSVIPLKSSFPESGRSGLGSESMAPLRAPRVAVVFGGTASLGDVSGIWYTLEQEFRLPFEAISVSALNGNLDRFGTIIVPSGTGASATAELKSWVRRGGCLVTFDSAGWLSGGNGVMDLSVKPGNLRELPGALFLAEIDPRSFLGYGYAAAESGKPIPLPVPVAGGTFFNRKVAGGSVVGFSDAPGNRLLSGWEWPDETENALKDTLWLQDEPVGSGRVVFFTNNPTDRAMWPGLHKMLLNAIILGPGQ